MKNKLTARGFFLITIILLFGSCLSFPTAQITVNDTVPQEDCADVMVSSNITITEFNGMDIKDEWYPKKRSKNLHLTVPAGETQFIYNMYWLVSYGQVTSWLEGKNLSFSYNFEAGKKYTIGYYSKPVGFFLLRKHELYFAIWDCLYPNATPDKSHESKIIKQWYVSKY